jgi:hypothetical protein
MAGVGKPTTAWDEDTGRYSIACILKTHPLALNTYKDEAEALKAWRLWYQSTKSTKQHPTKPHIPSLREAAKRGVCMQCLGPAWHETTGHSGYRHESDLVHYYACGMNLCVRCYRVHLQSLINGLRPSEDVPFDYPGESLMATDPADEINHSNPTR